MINEQVGDITRVSFEYNKNTPSSLQLIHSIEQILNIVHSHCIGLLLGLQQIPQLPILPLQPLIPRHNRLSIIPISTPIRSLFLAMNTVYHLNILLENRSYLLEPLLEDCFGRCSGLVHAVGFGRRVKDILAEGFYLRVL